MKIIEKINSNNINNNKNNKYKKSKKNENDLKKKMRTEILKKKEY